MALGPQRTRYRGQSGEPTFGSPGEVERII